MVIKFFSVTIMNICMKEINSYNQKKKKKSPNINQQINSQANKKFSFISNYRNCTYKILQEYEKIHFSSKHNIEKIYLFNNAKIFL